MSNQVDNRVVSMQFDNKNFEKNVAQTMSTLDKFKAKLNLSGASKGLEEVNNAAKKVDMTKLEKGVEAVRVKFSALEVIGVTALTRITNKAIDAGERLAKSLSIDQLTAGYSKYEQKTASVQTIMNATGKSIDEVNKYLEKLMWFSDETSYGFTDMTAALGQMTSSGGDIEKLIPLITGVANATAYAGKGASEFSRVMYNLNQSYGAGYLQLMDWKSVELAGVGSKQLKQTLIDTAVELGKIKQGEVTVSNFAQTLKDKWADTEVMEKAFGKFGEFSDAVHAMVQSGEVDTAAEAIEKLSGQYGELGVKAFKSAQEAKSFTEAIDATKDAVSSGWMRTYEIIFGNYEQAKKLWTDLANTLWDVFASGGDRRNEWLKEVLSYNPLTKFVEKLETVSKTVNKVTDAVKDYKKIVNQVIRGDFGNGVTRIKKLTAAGWEYAEVQNRVNEKLGYSKRHATKASAAQAEQTKIVAKLSDAKLKELGLTKEEIELYRDLEKQSEKTGKSIEELVSEMESMDGRSLLLQSFKNIGSALVGIFKALREAWSEIFPPASAVQVYNILSGFERLTECLRLTDKETGELNETGQKIKRTFKGVFAIIDLITTVISTAFKTAFDIVGTAVGGFSLDIFGATATVGDMLVAFRDWVKENKFITKAFSAIGTVIKFCITTIKQFISTLINLPIVQKGIKAISEAFSKIGPAVKKAYDSIIKAFQNGGIAGVFSKMVEIGSNVISGLVNGIKSGAPKVFNAIIDVGKKMIDWICKVLGIHSPSLEFSKIGLHVISGLVTGLKNGAFSVKAVIKELGTLLIDTICKLLGIHSPSKVMMTIGGFIIAGLIAGLASGEGDLTDKLLGIGNTCIDVIKTIVGNIINFIKNIDIGSVFIAGIGVGLVFITNKISNALLMFGEAAKGFGKLASGAGKLLSDIGDRINPKKNKFNQITKGILELAMAIAILVASVYVLTKIDSDRLWPAIGALAALAGIIVVMSAAAALVNAKGGSFGKLSIALIGITAALWIMAGAIKKLSFLNEDNWKYTLGGLAAMIVGLGLIFYAFGTFVKGKSAQNISKAGGMIFKLSLTLMLMVGVMKLISKLDNDEINKGFGFIIAFGVIVVGLTAMTRLAGNKISSVSKMMIKIAGALLLMAWVTKILGGMKPRVLERGLLGIIAFSGIIVGLMAATKLIAGSKNVDKIGGAIIKISGAIFMMAIAAKIIATMKPDAFNKGLLGIIAFSGVIVGLMAATKLIVGSKNVDKIGGAIAKIAGAILMIAFTAILLSFIKTENLAKGIVAVTMLSGVIAGLIYVTKFAKDCKGTLVGLTVAIGVLTACVIALSFVNPKKLAGATIAIGVLMGMFSLMIKASGKAKKATGTLIAMTIAIGMMAGAIYLVAQLPIERTIGAAVALSVLMLALSASLVIIGGAGKFVKDALLGIVALTAMAIPLLAFVGVLALMQNVQNVMPNVMALVALTTAMTLLLIPLTIVGAFGMLGLPYLGVLALLTMAIPMLAFIGVLALMQNISGATENAVLLIALMESMTKCLVALSLVAPLAALAVIVMPMLVLAITAVGGLIAAVGALVTKFPQLETFIDTGIPLLEKVANGIGSILGNFISGFAVGAMSGLPKMGSLLSEFMEKATPFIEGASKIKPSMMAGVGSLAKVILILTAADLIQSLTSWLTGGSSIADFAGQLKVFGKGMKEFSDEVKDINPSVVTAAATAAESLSALAHNLPNSGGLISWFTGENDIGTFGEQLVIFGEGMKKYSDEVKDIDPAVVMASARAAESLSELAHNLPNSGGVVSWFTGDNDIADFGEQLVTFGEGMKKYSDEVKDIKPAVVTASARAAESLSELASKLPNTGGVKSWFAGDNDMGDFGEQLVEFGKGLRKYSEEIADIEPSVITASARAAESLSELASNLPDLGGLESLFPGDMEEFGRQLPILAKGIKNFSDEITKDGGVDADAVTSAGNATKALADVAAKLYESKSTLQEFVELFVADTTIQDFAATMPALGEAIKAYSDAITPLEGQTSIDPKAVEASSKAIKNLAEAAETIPSETGKFKEFIASVKDSAWDINYLYTTIGMVSQESITKFNDIVNTIKSLGEKTKGKEGDVEAFGKSITALKNHIIVFVTSLSNIETEYVTGAVEKLRSFISLADDLNNKIKKPDNLVSAAEALKTLADTATAIPEDTSYFKTFVDNVEEVSGKLVTVFTKIGGITKENITKLEDILTSLEKLNTISEDEAKNAADFGTNLGLFADNVSDFVTTMTGVTADQIKGSISKLNEFVDVANSLKTDKVELLGEFSATLLDIAENSVAKFADNLEDESCLEIVSSAAETLVSNMASSIKTETNKQGFKDAGTYLIGGLAEGITAGKSKATTAAQAVADAVEKIIRSAWEVNSPSKLFYRIALGIGEGITYALDDSTKTVGSSARDLADTATNGFGNAIQKIVEFINTDMDTQPTIRPVLDLSDVRSGANTINGMFSGNRTLTISAPGVGAIAASMSARQNGNNDLVSAINKLAKSSNKSGDTYQINGINYNEGSDVADAIQTLVRAANIERRA